VTNGTNRCQAADHEALVGYVYDELPAEDRARLDAHLAACTDCREELDELRGVRAQLTDWAVPATELGFAVVGASERRRLDLRRFSVPAGLAAAAVLVLAVAAAIANVEITYGSDGLTVRTGWARADAQAAAAPEERTADSAPVAVLPLSASGASPWRDDLSALERRLKSEFQSIAAPAPAPASRGSSVALSDAELLRRVQALIEQSEHRQRRELAVRVAQLAREFDSQRQTDLVRIQQGLGQLEGSSAADRQLLNYLVRVSQRP
jgi:anti-sigma factor RsiW